ncbi:MAG: 4-hydroxy-tetrahydrodipicolinate reductase [Chloroflexota bacterium]
MTIRVLIAGALGRMGREMAAALPRYEGIEVVGGVSPFGGGQDLGQVTTGHASGALVHADLAVAIAETRPDVLVDFTIASAAVANSLTALRSGVRPVVGTTGIAESDLARLAEAAENAGLAIAVIPNFAIGAALLERYCVDAARYLPDCTVIELHHNRKLDAPSGTARHLGAAIAAARSPERGTPEILSVRLPGLVAHHEVIFGGLGQTLTLRHDSISRESFAPGVALAVSQVMRRRGMIRRLLDLME